MGTGVSVAVRFMKNDLEIEKHILVGNHYWRCIELFFMFEQHSK